MIKATPLLIQKKKTNKEKIIERKNDRCNN